MNIIAVKTRKGGMRPCLHVYSGYCWVFLAKIRPYL